MAYELGFDEIQDSKFTIEALDVTGHYNHTNKEHEKDKVNFRLY
jgi:hypothetical protein